MGTKLNLVNQRFGRLLVLEDAGHNASNRTIWKCQCDCGNIYYPTTSALRSGECKSCGCYHKELLGNHRRKHGCSGTLLYKRWKNIRRKCNNPTDHEYNYYGGRGIKVCPEWDNLENGFENFKTWAESNGYAKGLTIDRINNNGDYEPSNCRWTNMKTQGRNRRITRKVEYNGNLITIKELSELYNIDYYLLYDRIIKYNITVEDAIQNLLVNGRPSEISNKA